MVLDVVCSCMSIVHPYSNTLNIVVYDYAILNNQVQNYKAHVKKVYKVTMCESSSCSHLHMLGSLQSVFPLCHSCSFIF
jgi:hypothetical protein